MAGKPEYNGFCKRHRNKAPVQAPTQAPVQVPVQQIHYQQNEPIPTWALDMPQEEKKESLKPLPETNTFIISNTPEEHFGNLMILHGYGKLQDLLKNNDFDNFTCQICFADDLKPNEIYVFEECNHYYCLECLNHTLKVKVDDKAVDNLICPCDGCDHKITHNETRCILSNDKDLWQKYDQKLFDLTLSQMGDVRYCPNPKCGTAMCGSKDAPLMICPKCQLNSCFNCKEEYHHGSTCAKHQQWKKENCKGDVAFENWMKKQENMKACPRCKVSIQRPDGCNHMTCANCKYHFHWITLKQWKGYANEANVWGTEANPVPLNRPVVMNDRIGHLHDRLDAHLGALLNMVW